MKPPRLASVVAEASRLAPSHVAVSQLVAALADRLGVDRFSTVEAVRRAASTDYAHLSPLLTQALPQRPADIVVRPQHIDELPTVLALAHEHQVPVVPRGRGTGNYGQAVPLAGGIVVDLTRLDAITAVDDGWITAQAGATFVALEAAARRSGQQITLQPTTFGSTLGGFLAGGAGGIGSIRHGWLWDGFVAALDVITCPPAPQTLTVHAAQCLPYLHAYGVTGLISAATVRLEPAREWFAVMISCATFASAAQIGQSLLHTDPTPRLVSLDDPAIVATYPEDPRLPAGRYSLRALVDQCTAERLQRTVHEPEGIVEAVFPDNGYLSTLAFNHVTLRAKRARPTLCHLQVSGAALISQPDQVRATLPAAMLHLDGLRSFMDPVDPLRGRGFGGLLLSEFQSAQLLYEGIDRLQDLGVHVVDPHTWLLSGPTLPLIQLTAAANDPRGLLNPGRLPTRS